MKTIRFSTMLLLVAVSCVALCARADAQTISATQVNEKTIRVAVPAKFEVDVSMVKGFGHTFFDLAHDPDKKRNIAPVLEEAGLLWTKLGVGDGQRVGGPNPPKKMELLEAGPARVRVRISGVMNRRGQGIPAEDLPELGFEQTFTVYPTGGVFVDYGLVAKEPLVLHHFLLILKPNGAWGKSGKGEGAKEARCAGEFGPDQPYGKTESSLALEWTNGPTYFQDILMVMQKGKYKGTYWDEGYLDMDLRCGLDVLSRWPDRKLAAGTDHIYLMMCLRDDINGHEAAAPYANDYRSPDKLTFTAGKADAADPGDADADGYNEAEGCYVIAGADSVAFTLHGKAVPRMYPAFKIKGWKDEAPKTIQLAGASVESGKDFNASVKDGVLLLQLLKPITEDVQVTIPKKRQG